MKTEIIYHNPDNLETAGDPPWRFLVEGEEVQNGDQVWNGGHHWFRSHRSGSIINEHTYRTRRPLPAPQPGGGEEGIRERLEATTHMLENLITDLRKHDFHETAISNVRAVIAKNRMTLEGITAQDIHETRPELP